jgi:hypothetical protein
MAHAHLRRCRQQNVPHTNRKHQQTPTAQSRCTDAEFLTQLAVLVAEATRPVVQIRRRSPQVQHAKPPDATNARTRRTTAESEPSGTGRHKDQQRHNHAPPAPSSTGTAKQAQKRKDEHTHHLPRVTTENSTKRKHTRAKTEQHHGKRRGRENNKHKQKRRRTKKKERNSTTNKQTQTQTNNTILSRMNPPPSEPHQPTTQKSRQMRGAGVRAHESENCTIARSPLSTSQQFQFKSIHHAAIVNDCVVCVYGTPVL